VAVADLLTVLKSAPWQSEDEVRQAAASWGVRPPAEILKALEVVGGRRSGPERLHGFRCLALCVMVELAPDRSLFAPFVRALRSADPELRATLARLLPAVNNVAEHASLCALLRTSDAGLRSAVAEALSAIGGKTVFDTLWQLVLDPSFAGRSEVMDVLVAIAEHRAVPALKDVLGTGSPQEKAKAIGLISSPRCMAREPAAALAAIASALHDSNEAVVVQAIAAFAQVCSEDDFFLHIAPSLESPSPGVVRAAVEGLRFFPTPRAVSTLQLMLRRGPNPVRLAAIDGLDAIGIPDVHVPLVEALSHRNARVRVRAGHALSRLSQAGKLDLSRTVIWLLRSKDLNLRRMAVELAQSVPDASGQFWPTLLGFLRDEDWWVRERVADALVELAGDKILRHVAALLKEPSPVFRRFAVDVLKRLKAPASIGALVRTAGSDSDWWVREGAVEAIGALKDPQSVPYLVDLMLSNPDLQLVCLHALGETGAAEAAPYVVGLLGADHPDVRKAALECLSALHAREQAGPVTALLRDPRAELRAQARELLAEWESAIEPEPAAADVTMSSLDRLLLAMAQRGADDLAVVPGRCPYIKRLGRMEPLNSEILASDSIRALLGSNLSLRQWSDLEAGRDVDISYALPGEGLRFRVNVFRQLDGLAAVFRIIKRGIPKLEELGLPPAVCKLGELQDGLVLVGGPTGSGKSTTLAAIIDSINRTSHRHIITFEDPIEVVHSCASSLVNQRELGTHTGAFDRALRATLREDPDVILVGEMRDYATISFAVTAAETGHLVFGTIHTVSAAQSIDRLINAFPAAQQDQVRSMLAGSLRAVVCQFLHERRDAPGRCLSVEVMLTNEAVANLIRKGKTFQIPSVIATSKEAGMQLMDGELSRLLREGKISGDDAYVKAANKKDFEGFVADAAPKAPAGR
jgi:twitching motility protein PilT